MAAPPPDARALAARLVPGKRQPDLTAQIEACACPPLVKAGLWLLNGDVDAAHRTVQALDGPVAAHWHALVHRREPDLPNSKYWQRRAGASPVYPALLTVAGPEGEAAGVAPGGQWDALRFTDCFGDPAHDGWSRKVDRAELEALLAHCMEG